MEGKRNDTGMRFVLQQAVESNQGGLLWGEDHFPALIDWKDVVVAYGLRQGIKYAQLVRRLASSPRARGADGEGNRYFVQVIVEGTPYQKAKTCPAPIRWNSILVPRRWRWCRVKGKLTWSSSVRNCA